ARASCGHSLSQERAPPCQCARSVLYCFFFFFSSRRRHTRCYRDWSSDVCSSDLPPTSTEQGLSDSRKWADALPRTTNLVIYCGRSEERRVGKECRYRWSR